MPQFVPSVDDKSPVSPWDREHIEAPHRNLNKQDAASLEVGEEDLDYCICHEYDAEDDHI